VLSGFTVLEDRAAVIEADPDQHRTRWRSWLRWGDLLQFVGTEVGDGAQLAASDLDLIDPAVLAISDGTGVFLALRAHDNLDDSTPGKEPSAASLAPDWRAALDLIDPDEPMITQLARALAELGAPVPDIGYELGPDAWQAEVIWPARQIAILANQNDPDERRQRDAAFANAGWHARVPQDWTVDELARLLVARRSTTTTGEQ